MKSKISVRPTLRELQSWMRLIITDPRGARDIAPAPACLGLVDSERLDIYAESYFARIVEALKADFTTVARIMGDNLFRRVVADYLKEFPSRFSNIGEVGRDLPQFLSGYDFIAASPYLPELAGLEWAVIESYYSDDNPPISLAQLGAVPGEKWSVARFRVNASVQTFRADWPVDLLWKTDPAESIECLLEALAPEAIILLVHRLEGGAVRVRRLSAQEQEVLGWIRNQITLGEICVRLEHSCEEPPPIQAWFHDWTRQGIICGIEFETTATGVASQ